MAASEFNPRRKSFSGLVVNKQVQFKLAVACSSVLLLPSLILTVSLLSRLSIDTLALANAGVSSADLGQFVLDRAFRDALIALGTFTFFGALSMFLSLKLSNQMVGPVQRLEIQLKDMIAGKFEPRSPLRKGDYLKNLGDLINELSAQRQKDSCWPKS